MRATEIELSSWTTDCASPASSSPAPNTIWPPASKVGRGTYRVRNP
jgi:hypothetical protein